MTTAEAISFVRMLLDEPKAEFYSDATFLDALREAASVVARDCWYRGEKEAIRPLFTEVSGPIDSAMRFVMPARFLFIDSVRSNFANPTGPKWLHVYVDPAVFSRRRHRAPAEGASGISFNAAERFVSRAEFTIIGNDVYATGSTTAPTNNKDIHVSYIAVPAVSSTLSDPMPMAEYIHPVICDVAAGLLYRKEHPGDDRAIVGTVADLSGAMYKMIRGQQR